VKFLGVFKTTNGENYIVTEFMNNGSLLDLLHKNNQLPFAMRTEMYVYYWRSIGDYIDILLQTYLYRLLDAARGMAYLEGKKVCNY
jgi:hypothetical protein